MCCFSRFPRFRFLFTESGVGVSALRTQGVVLDYEVTEGTAQLDRKQPAFMFELKRFRNVL